MKLKIILIYLVLLFMLGCRDNFEEPNEPIHIPKVNTLYSFVSKTSAIMGGKISPDSVAVITDCGVTWSKSQNPDSTELITNRISLGPRTGTFYAPISGLETNSDYFVQAYATNEAGTGYGQPILITTEFEPDPNLPVDPAYPNTYYPLDALTLANNRNAFAQRNKFLTSTINNFGFCDYGKREVEDPPFAGDFTLEEAVEKAKQFCTLNPSETGVNNPEELALKNSSYSILNSGSAMWSLDFFPQIYDTIQFYKYSKKLIFRVINKEVTYCDGNWYPEIYIPSNFNFDQEQAKAFLVGRIMTYSDFGGGAHYIKISTNHINSPHNKISLIIYPVTDTDKTELRVVWRLYIPEVFNVLYVDVMTGEIILKEPTSLS